MSFPYKKILCPIDFDGTAEAALKEATALAHPGNGVVILFHAVFINPIASEGFALAELQDSLEREARIKLEQMADHLEGCAHEIVVSIGIPTDCILASAKALNADLIVMATHGRRGVSHLILGSVAERVIRLSSTPVLTVHPESVAGVPS